MKNAYEANIIVGTTANRPHMVPLITTIGDFRKINFKIPLHQRQNLAWNVKDVLRLLDTTLRGLSMPAFFIRDKEGRMTLEDGLQRDTSLAVFMKGEIRLPAGTIFQMPEGWVNPMATVDADVDDGVEEDDDGESVLGENMFDGSGLSFNELPSVIVDQFLNTPVVVQQMRNFSDDDAREYFVRLQGGKPLNATERQRAQQPKLAGVARSIATSKDTKQFFKNVGMLPDTIDAKRSKNNRLQVEGAATDFLTLAASEQIVAINAANKAKLADKMLSKNSPEVTSTIETLKLLGQITETLDEDERKLIKKTTQAPLFRATLDRVTEGELNSKKEVKAYTDALVAFLKQVDDAEDQSSKVQEYRKLAGSGSNSQASIQGRYEILIDELAG